MMHLLKRNDLCLWVIRRRVEPVHSWICPLRGNIVRLILLLSCSLLRDCNIIIQGNTNVVFYFCSANWKQKIHRIRPFSSQKGSHTLQMDCKVFLTWIGKQILAHPVTVHVLTVSGNIYHSHTCETVLFPKKNWLYISEADLAMVSTAFLPISSGFLYV